MRYVPFKANPDLWTRPEICWEDKDQYNMYMFSYGDDILCIHQNADSVLEHLYWSFPFKPKYGNPDLYLGTMLQKIRLHNGVWSCASSLTKYVHQTVSYFKACVRKKFNGRFRMPMKAKVSYTMDMIQS